jgi:NAD(P)-dependent dehydrogenase (short-subunit alcohol dehydrogenase family)
VVDSERFAGRNALITGGGSGIGAATAKRFAAEGLDHVFLVDLRAERADAVAKEVEAMGGRATPVAADISTRDNCEAVISRAADADGKLDILISNAAAWTEESFLDMKRESWDRVLAVNLNASFDLGQGAARLMRDTGSGVILFTSSISSLGASELFAHYGVSKAAIVNLVQNMAIELAPYHIRVNCVSPGPANTQQSVDIVGEERMEEFRRSFPIVPLEQRLAEPEEIAAAFAFLASDDASYVTGHNLIVDGGLTAHAYSIPEGE